VVVSTQVHRRGEPRDKGVVADFIKIGPTPMDPPRGYAVLVDRISHEVPFYGHI